MMNQDNPYAMNQTCKVCGEPAAGFHFGAFTCEGCKSFFGRSYNNLSSISDCKNNGECIINKKNRTACKACRLRKCLTVGMSKSGSRYGRRSNWFKIHCLLQEQQQQAAAMAAHHNSHHHQQLHQQHQQHHQQHAVAAAAAAAAAQKSFNSGVPTSPVSAAAAAAAFGMLGHAGGYPGLYPPRTREELMMLGLEDYAKHAAASPSVSSPDSHNSDSSLEVSVVRNNALLQLAGNAASNAAGKLDNNTVSVTGGNADGGKAASTGNSGGTGLVGPPPPPPQVRKDLPPFLPLPFPGFPVMPPPAFVPPPHLLFSSYHPALYQHHQGLLKPSPEQQQQAAAAAAAVQHLFNAAAPNRFTPPLAAAVAQHSPSLTATSAFGSSGKPHDKEQSLSPHGPMGNHLTNNNNNSNINNNNSSKGTPLNGLKTPQPSTLNDELSKRFYLDAVLKSQRKSPPPATTKLPHGYSKHDHSISALVTPNSESGREQHASRQSNVADEELDDERDGESVQQHVDDGDDDEDDCGSSLKAVHSNGNGEESDAEHKVNAASDEENDVDDDDEDDLVVSMTPPRSPANINAGAGAGQEIPIDLSMKTGNSLTSCAVSSKCSSNGSQCANEQSDSEHDDDEVESTTTKCEQEQRSLENAAQLKQNNACGSAAELLAVDNHCDNSLDNEGQEHVAESSATGQLCNNNNLNSNNNNNKGSSSISTATPPSAVKRKLHDELPALDVSGSIKRVKLQMEANECEGLTTGAKTATATTTTANVQALATTTAAAVLDLSAKV